MVFPRTGCCFSTPIMKALIFLGIILFLITNACSSTNAGRFSTPDEVDATSSITLRSSQNEFFDVTSSIESETYRYTEALTEPYSTLVFEEHTTVSSHSVENTFETNSLSRKNNLSDTNLTELYILMNYLLNNRTHMDLPSSNFNSLISEALSISLENKKTSSMDLIASLQIRPAALETHLLSSEESARSLQIEPITVKTTILPSIKKEERLNVTSDLRVPEKEPNKNESLNLVNNFFKDLISDLSFLLNGKNMTKSMLDALPYFKDDYTEDKRIVPQVVPYITENGSSTAEFSGDSVNNELTTGENATLAFISPSVTITNLISINESKEKQNNFTFSEFSELDLQATDTIPSSEEAYVTKETYLVLILRKNCTDSNNFSDVIESLNNTVLNAIIDLNKGKQLTCEKYFSLKIPIQNANVIFDDSAVKKMKFDPLLHENFEIVRFFLNVSDHENVPLFPPSETCDDSWEESIYGREIIIYIMATIIVSLLLIIIIVFLVRFLCCKQTKSLDLCDIPHLNLKLEDYKLTPIPRPTISIPDSNRDILHAYNETYTSRPSRIEDTILTQHHFSGKPSNNLNIAVGQNHSAFPQELRKFGAKRSCSRVQTLDVETFSAEYGPESWILKHKKDKGLKKGTPGIDNPLFRK